VLRCERPIQAGEPLTISYGSKENAELLYGRALDLRGRDVELCAHALQQFIRYGFALRSNPSDAAPAYRAGLRRIHPSTPPCTN